uniref:CID domain-containing protein n=1 Tax=Rhabditophanes sp. KR3021 TaxID=114890 RepID=A0AC35TP13_9BILA
MNRAFKNTLPVREDGCLTLDKIKDGFSKNLCKAALVADHVYDQLVHRKLYHDNLKKNPSITNSSHLVDRVIMEINILGYQYQMPIPFDKRYDYDTYPTYTKSRPGDSTPPTNYICDSSERMLLKNRRINYTVNIAFLNELLEAIDRIKMFYAQKACVVFLDIKTAVGDQHERLTYVNVKIDDILYCIHVDKIEQSSKFIAEFFTFLLSHPNTSIVCVEATKLISKLFLMYPRIQLEENSTAVIVCLVNRTRKIVLNAIKNGQFQSYYPDTWQSIKTIMFDERAFESDDEMSIVSDKEDLNKPKPATFRSDRKMNFNDIVKLHTNLTFDDSEDNQFSCWGRKPLRETQISAMKAKILAMMLVDEKLNELFSS